MRKYIISYQNKLGEIFTEQSYAKNQTHLIKKLKLYNFKIVAITKLDKKLEDELL